jgi:hypothetical protein
MSFPLNPTNGQQATVNGLIYSYNSTIGAWTVATQAQSISLTVTSIGASGNVSGNYILGNAAFMSGIPASYTDSNVTSLLASFGSNVISGTGNITGGNITTSQSLGVGTTATSSYKLDVAGKGRFLQDSAATTGAIILRASVSNTTSPHLQFVSTDNSAQYGYITINAAGVLNTTSSMVTTGNITAASVTTTGGRSLFTAVSEPFAVASRYNSSGGYVYFGASDATATPGIQLSLATGAAGLSISTAGVVSGTSFSATGNITGGNLTTAGALSAATITETSSRDLKTNFRRVENALETVLHLSAWIYDRKDGSETDELGLVAEEVDPVIKNLVMHDNNGKPVGIKYTRVGVLCIEAIKDLHNEIQELKQLINK